MKRHLRRAIGEILLTFGIVFAGLLYFIFCITWVDNHFGTTAATLASLGPLAGWLLWVLFKVLREAYREDQREK